MRKEGEKKEEEVWTGGVELYTARSGPKDGHGGRRGPGRGRGHGHDMGVRTRCEWVRRTSSSSSSLQRQRPGPLSRQAAQREKPASGGGLSVERYVEKAIRRERARERAWASTGGDHWWSQFLDPCGRDFNQTANQRAPCRPLTGITAQGGGRGGGRVKVAEMAPGPKGRAKEKGGVPWGC